MIRSSRTAVRAVLAVVLLLVVSGCGSQDASSLAGAPDGAGDGVTVVVTTTILGDLVGQVVGDVGRVEVLMPVGADPHGFAPSAAQANAVRDADLVVANGLGLEEGLLAVVDAAADDGVEVFTATDHTDLIPLQADGTDDGAMDPHIWFDPLRMAGVVTALGQTLTRIDATTDWAQRAGAVADQLTALDAEVAEILTVVPDEQRVLVTSHDVLEYLAQRYDLTVAATIIPGGSTLAEPSAAALDDIVEVITRTGAKAIFAESSNPGRLAQVVADEVGRDVQVVELFTESLSAPDGVAPTYADLMRVNANRIAAGLTGQPGPGER